MHSEQHAACGREVLRDHGSGPDKTAWAHGDPREQNHMAADIASRPDADRGVHIAEIWRVGVRQEHTAEPGDPRLIADDDAGLQVEIVPCGHVAAASNFQAAEIGIPFVVRSRRREPVAVPSDSRTFPHCQPAKVLEVVEVADSYAILENNRLDVEIGVADSNVTADLLTEPAKHENLER